MAENEFKFRKKLGQLLLEKNLVSEDKLHWAIEQQAASKKFLGEILIEANLVKEEELLKVLAEQDGITFLDLKKDKIQINREIVARVPPSVIKRFGILPFQFKDGAISVLVSNTIRLRMQPEIEKILSVPVKMMLTTRKYLELIVANILENVPYHFDVNDPECIRYKKIETIGITASAFTSDKKKLLGELLIERGLISEEQLNTALNEQQQHKKELQQILVEHNLLDEEQSLELDALMHQTVFISLINFTPQLNLLKYFKPDEMKQVPFLPINSEQDLLRLAVSRLDDLTFFNKFNTNFPYKLEFYLAREGEIINALGKIDLDAISRQLDLQELKISRIKEKGLAKQLVKMGYLTAGALDAAWKKSEEQKQLLTEYLVDTDQVKQVVINKIRDLRPVLEFVNLEGRKPDLSVVKLAPPEVLMKCRAIPIDKSEFDITVAIAEDDAETVRELDQIRLATNLRIRCMLADEQEILRMQEEVFGPSGSIIKSKPVSPPAEEKEEVQVLKPVPVPETDSPTEESVEILDEFDLTAEYREYSPRLKDSLKLLTAVRERQIILDPMDRSTLDTTARDSAVANFLDNLLQLALRKSASHIHLEPGEKILRVSVRVNGAIILATEAPLSLGVHLISRIMALSKIEMTEAKVPYSGSFKHKSGNFSADVMV
ncbi:MAG: hypothetical protein PHW04_18015, partial [Candidatus Wallbacteria bacterium]|nr:hypothetical protein [Candidatus Wallbacteria bacterium]